MSCDNRPANSYIDRHEILVEVDWDGFPERPTGMTVLFYNQSSGYVYRQSSNNISESKLSLPEGQYDALIFNQSEREFSFIALSDLNSFDKISVSALTTEDARLDWLGADILRNLSVKADTTIHFRPHNITCSINLVIVVDGLQNLRSLSAKTDGFAATYYLGQNCPSTSSTQYTLNNWTTDNYSNCLTTNFRFLGVSGATPSINLEFLLVDNKTVLDTTVVINPDLIPDITPYIDVTLPEVQPATPSDGSGFNVDVGVWQPENIVIPMTRQYNYSHIY